MQTWFIAGPLAGPACARALNLPEGETAAMADAALAAGAGPALPAVVARSGAVLAGAILRPDGGAVARLNHLAACIGWRVVPGPVALAGGGAADAALLPPEAGDDAAEWDAAEWERRWAPLWPHALREIEAYRGRFAPETIAGRIRPILTRAHSRAMAEASGRPTESGFGGDDVEIRAHRRPYSAFFALDEYDLVHRTFAGGATDEMSRAVFVAADAVTVLPWDPARDRVLVIEQFRVGPLGRGDPAPWLLEPVAGRIDPGDTPEETAYRETVEEAGITLETLHKVAEFYPTTGAVSEYLTAYVGIADLPDGAAGLHGLETEHEDIRGHLMPRAELMARIAAGRAPNGPLMLTAFWLEAHAGRLRAGG